MFIFLVFLNIFSNKVAQLAVIEAPIKTYMNSIETKVDNYQIPLDIVPGMELKFDKDSKGQILLDNSAVLFVAPYSQISFEKIGRNNMLINVMYGSIYYLGSAPVSINSRAISAKSSGGSFAFKYNRNKLNGIFFNFNAKMTVKHAWDSKTYKLKPNNAFVVYSYNDRKKLSTMNQKYINEVKSLFDMSFAPGGKIFFSKDIISTNQSKYELPSMKGNIDFIRRVVNIF